MTNRWEVVCLDVAPLLARTGEPREVWKLDMPEQLGVFGRSPSMGFNLRCAVGASYHGRIYVITGNGVGEDWQSVPAPDAPSLVCLDRDTGEVLWKDSSPGKDILATQCASPLVAEVGGRAQVVAPQGDGWVRSFDAMTGEPLWAFDANETASAYPHGGRNELLAAPVLYDGRIYIGTGRDAEHGQGPAILWCIDPTRRGDVSEELDDGPANAPADGPAGDTGRAPGLPGGPRKGRPNPNSAVVWKFAGRDENGDGKVRRKERFNRSASGVAAADGLVVAADFSGFVHCLDAATGERLWAHDVLAEVYGSPLVCDGKVFVAGGDGRVHVLALAREKRVLAEGDVGDGPVYCSPVLAGGVLYLATYDTLYAIREQKAAPAADGGGDAGAQAAARGEWPQYRGPGRTNVSADTGLLAEWPAQGPPLLWKAEGLGEGVPSVAVSGGRVYTLGYRQGGEFLSAWEAATGGKLWDQRVGPAVQEQPSMRWLSQRTPTVDGDRVYVVTARGELVCMPADGGPERWRKDYSKDFGGEPGQWGYCDYPLVDGDRLICTPGGGDADIVALDKLTGELL